MRVFFTSLCLDLALFSLQANTRSWSEWLYCGEGGRRRCCATRRSVEYCVVCAVWRSMRVGYEVLVCLCAVCERVRLVRRWGCAPCVHSGVRSFAHLAHRSLHHIGIPGCALALATIFFVIHAMWCESKLYKKKQPPPLRRPPPQSRDHFQAAADRTRGARRSSPRAGRGRSHALDATKTLHNRS